MPKTGTRAIHHSGLDVPDECHRPEVGPNWWTGPTLRVLRLDCGHRITALFVPPGRLRPTETREHIAQRYELCEDMAQMLTETAQTKRFELGITEADVLKRAQVYST